MPLDLGPLVQVGVHVVVLDPELHAVQPAGAPGCVQVALRNLLVVQLLLDRGVHRGPDCLLRTDPLGISTVTEYLGSSPSPNGSGVSSFGKLSRISSVTTFNGLLFAIVSSFRTTRVFCRRRSVSGRTRIVLRCES